MLRLLIIQRLPLNMRIIFKVPIGFTDFNSVMSVALWLAYDKLKNFLVVIVDAHDNQVSISVHCCFDSNGAAKLLY